MIKTISDFPLITASSLTDDSFFSALPLKELLDQGAVLLIDKPAAWTSFDAVNKIRRVTNAKKVGHCGTLDPFATGLLIVCTGKATKIVDQFSRLSKIYDAEFEIGKTTDTLDSDGKITGEKDVPDFDAAFLESVCLKYTGEIEQVPPQYSAIKVGGAPAYKKARKGEHVEIQKRKITVYEFTVTRYEKPILTVRIHCSKGTYVRALAKDVGIELGCGAYVRNLRRTAIGEFSIDAAVSISQIEQWKEKFKSSHVHSN